MWLWLDTQAVDPPSLQINLLPPTAACGLSSEGADVTVCARRDKDRYRIPPQYRTQNEREGLGRAETHIGKVGVGAATDRVDINGWPSNRIMLTIKIPI